jgi:hypothetical protein
MRTKDRILIISIVIFILSITHEADDFIIFAQTSSSWSVPQTIPGYDDETLPPVLIPDQNRTVHAFTTQPVDADRPETAVFYNKWTMEYGWSNPVDILLSPIKQQARLLDAFLDSAGIVHVLFFGGDETEANIYYSKAPAEVVDRASAWTKPSLIGESALIPEDGAIGGSDNNLVIVYSGNREGNGYYALYSKDSGDSWSDPVPIFLTYQEDLSPFDLAFTQSGSGWLHAVWNTNDVSGQGRSIFYARLKIGETRWSDPLELAHIDEGLGTKAPSIVESDNKLFVFYWLGAFMFIQSSDEGQTWTDPVRPFIHVGLNGPGSFVTDSNGTVHFLWGQRISGREGTADLHGMWYSKWQIDHWSEPEALVSGPRVSDMVARKAFDPTQARAVISQGNVLLVTWCSDFALRGNGVWYSFRIIDAPEQFVVPLPTQPAHSESTSTNGHISILSTPATNITPMPKNLKAAVVTTAPTPQDSITYGIIPVILIIALVVTYKLLLRTRKII